MMKAQQGFTLAELLIALALLGVIAAFTIPKVLNAASNNEAIAKSREAVSVLESTFNNIKLESRIDPTQDLYGNISRYINSVKQSTGSVTATTGTVGPLSTVATHPCAGFTGWVQLANGTVISGLYATPATAANRLTSSVPATATNNYMICIDYNAAGGPNVAGTDIFLGTFNQWASYGSAAPQDPARPFFWGDANNNVYPAGASTGALVTTGALSGGGASKVLGT